MQARRGGATLAAVAALWAVTAAGPAAAQPGHGHTDPGSGGAKVGLLIADHGEPPEYNERTYWSFRAFVAHLIEMGVIPAWLRALDGGTVLQDPSCYGCPEPRMDGGRIDAWLRPHDLPGVYVPGSDRLASHYLLPAGPGLGEPDIFEHAGLQVWNEWELMGGRSPNYDQKLRKKRAVIRRLRAHYERALPIRIGYGIDPRIGGRRQGIREAVRALVRRDRVDHIVMAYHGVGFSDLMQTHMLRHEAQEEAARLDPAVRISYARPLGATATYVRAIARRAHREFHALPRGARVALHLSGHGLPTGRCGDYDCGADAYHAFARDLFARTREAILRLADHHSQLGVFHIYGDGGTGDDDPQDRVDGPLEALAKRRQAGFTHVIDIPYEFDSDSRDTLIVLRRGYGRPIPDWDRRYESRFVHHGLAVKITNASFGSPRKTRALESVITEALARAGARPGSDGHGEHRHHGR
jgi:hypothetical protein